ncbi:hypothetical protein Nepgr_008820 [Nepenthes gracilis]|uniref:Uncharacterized protein n=1 Tax=Nepenthes gracilis TaxID=150966 RepID=A0AAD3S9D3_NEPGR|nr:hypothetical protein Nepgr_008820 [Nepenthes gracilis]
MLEAKRNARSLQLLRRGVVGMNLEQLRGVWIRQLNQGRGSVVDKTRWVGKTAGSATCGLKADDEWEGRM